jgi:hypothetical protein
LKNLSLFRSWSFRFGSEDFIFRADFWYRIRPSAGLFRFSAGGSVLPRLRSGIDFSFALARFWFSLSALGFVFHLPQRAAVGSSGVSRSATAGFVFVEARRRSLCLSLPCAVVLRAAAGPVSFVLSRAALGFGSPELSRNRAAAFVVCLCPETAPPYVLLRALGNEPSFSPARVLAVCGPGSYLRCTSAPPRPRARFSPQSC